MDEQDALPQRANARRAGRRLEADTANEEHECTQNYSSAKTCAAALLAGDEEATAAGPEPDAPFAYRAAAVGPCKFEYLDHTADVQLHAWGVDLKEAFEQCALAMFNYMTPIQHLRPSGSRTYSASGHDLQSLLYAFLDELLFVFNTDLFACCEVTITAFDREAFAIEAEGRGETFDRSRHEAGTEIKAITYSAMSIAEAEGDADVFVIVDI